jgi:hypothetical protein
MSGRDQIKELPFEADAPGQTDSAALLRTLVESPVRNLSTSAHETSVAGVVIGELLAITDDGTTPLVIFPGQSGTSALRAKTVVDLHGAYIGKCVVLMFELGNPQRPIVMGVLRGSAGWPLDKQPGQVEVDADGERLLVRAKEQLVLRCGKASITLTKAGKVLIQGDYISSRSTGVNRIKGGSVQLN